MLTLQALSSSANAGPAKGGCLARGEAFGSPPAVCPPERPRPFTHYREMGGVSRYFSEVSGSGIDLTLLKVQVDSMHALACEPCYHVCGQFTQGSVVIFFFPYNPHPLPPRQTPRPSHPRGLDFGPFLLRLAPFRLSLAPFGSVSAPFRVRFGVLGGVGAGSGRGASVREKNITQGSGQYKLHHMNLSQPACTGVWRGTEQAAKKQDSPPTFGAPPPAPSKIHH